MALTCNIDARGRRQRYRIGTVLVALGAAGVAAARLGLLHGWWPWALGGLLLLAGAFSWFEAKNSWCVVRALGFKTRV